MSQYARRLPMFLTRPGVATFVLKSGAGRSFDQGCELGHLILGLRIRRLGVRVPSGAQQIKAVTSRNAGYGLDRFPRCAAIFHSESEVLRRCSRVDVLFRRGPCRCALASADTRRPVRIMADLPPT